MKIVKLYLKIIKKIEFLKKAEKELIELKNRNYLLEEQINRVTDFLYMHTLSKKSLDAEKLIVIEVEKGLIDQINYYFIGRCLEKEYGYKVLYSIEWYNENIDGVRNSNRNFELLNLFPNLDFKIISPDDSKTFKELYCINKNNKYVCDLKYFGDTVTKRFYLSDFIVLNCKKELEERVKKEFNFYSSIYPQLNKKNLSYYEKISNSNNSIGIHIRRTDYIAESKKKNLAFPDIHYYLRSISILLKELKSNDATFFIFSDDPEWVKYEFIPNAPTNLCFDLVEGNDEKHGFIDFFLLMSTKHKIASSGRFCIAAHYFATNEDKILIRHNPISNEPELKFNDYNFF